VACPFGKPGKTRRHQRYLYHESTETARSGRGDERRVGIGWINGWGDLGGMYYRAIALASLGLALIIAAGLGRRRRDRAVVVAWLLVAIGLGGGLLATGPHWPRPVVPIRGLELISTMRGTARMVRWSASPFRGCRQRGDFEKSEPAKTGTYGGHTPQFAPNCDNLFRGRSHWEAIT